MKCFFLSSIQRTLYYLDTTRLSVDELASHETTINGSSRLGMPSTTESGNCTVFGCYLNSDTFLNHNFFSAFCVPGKIFTSHFSCYSHMPLN